jgi:acetoin utilization protein AcuB
MKSEETTMLVRDIMTQQPMAISPETTLPDAMRLMKKHSFRRLPVLKSKKLVGIVTDRDLKEAMPSDATSLSIWELNYLLSKLEVKEVMHSPVFTVTETMSVQDAAQLMLEKKIGGLPVMNKGTLTGIITVTDVLKTFVAKERGSHV